MFALLLACTSPTAPTDDSAPAADSGSTLGGTTTTPTVPALSYSGGACPTLTEGVNEAFVSGADSRTFRVLLPEEPQGAGVIFAWHWLGGSARDIERYMGLDAWADDLGFIVISPDASGDQDYEWDFTEGPDGNPDALFFDDLVACSEATWGADLGRLYAMGMSAGGLWTTWLTIYRADVLAATAPLSGGTSYYVSPAAPIPVLLTWGGPTDTYGGYSFETASETMSAGLRADGHFVVECVHDGGHTIPPEATDYVGRFFADHPGGVSPEPYLGGLPTDFPDWCRIP